MSSVLVSGGTGFVGGGVVRALLAAGHEVSLLNRGSRLIPNTLQLTADRNSADSLQRVLGERAFDAAVDTNAYTPSQARLLIAALDGRAPRVAVISSASVYGDDARQPPDEDQSTGGAAVWGDYGRDKSGVEAAYRQAADRFDHCAVVRPPYVFGAGNSGDRETWFWARQLNDLEVLIPGDGQTLAHFVHNDDLAAALVLLACGERRGFGVFNVADPHALSFSALATLLAETAGVTDRQIPLGAIARDVPPRAWFPFRDHPCLADPARFIAQTGWRPAHGLKERFAETLASYSRRALKSAYKPTETEQGFQRSLRP